uniref:Uncharacterized protein n=1 Tax=Anguilla anguilla TaxID=7936 RepID=A0A0E9W578_ANGAN
MQITKCDLLLNIINHHLPWEKYSCCPYLPGKPPLR